MPRARRPRTSLRPGRAALLALGASLAGLAVATPVGAQEVIIDPQRTETTLAVAPADRTQPGATLTFTATVVQVDSGEPVIGETLRFRVDGEVVSSGPLGADGRGQIVIELPQGAHVVDAALVAGDEATYASSQDHIQQSVLPVTCPDQAWHGARALVRHVYLSALQRCPDAAGYEYWSDRLDADGLGWGPLASTLARSAEAVDVVVDDAYRRILGRPADVAGRRVWAAKLRSGWATSQLWAALAASPEFAAGTDGPAGLVARAFDRIVDRPADAAGAAYWQARLAAGPPSSTWRALAVTAEVVDGVVADAHQSALGRAPSPSEADAARATIRSRRGDWRLLVAELLGRPEATTHAQRYPDPETDD